MKPVSPVVEVAVVVLAGCRQEGALAVFAEPCGGPPCRAEWTDRRVKQWPPPAGEIAAE